MALDPKKLPQPVMTKGGFGVTARIDMAIYVGRDGYVSFTQTGGIDYPLGGDRQLAHEALDVMLDEAHALATRQ